MKRIYSVYALIVLFVAGFGFSSSIQAQQCAGAIPDQVSPVLPTGIEIGFPQFNGFVYQSFTPTAPSISGVEIPVGPSSLASGELVVSLYGPVGPFIPFGPVPPLGPALASGTSNTVGPGGGVAFIEWPTVALAPPPAGQFYVLEMSVSPASLPSPSVLNHLTFFSSNDPNSYPGGDQFSAPPAPFFPITDMAFATYFCPPPPNVPTMGQWGLILLALILVSFGTAQVFRQKFALASAGEAQGQVNMKFGLLPFSSTAYTKGLISSALLTATIFTVAIVGFGYEFIRPDIFGIVFGVPILGYLLQFLFIDKD